MTPLHPPSCGHLICHFTNHILTLVYTPHLKFVTSHEFCSQGILNHVVMSWVEVVTKEIKILVTGEEEGRGGGGEINILKQH